MLLASRLKVAPGVAVSLPVGSTCNWKAGSTADLGADGGVLTVRCNALLGQRPAD